MRDRGNTRSRSVFVAALAVFGVVASMTLAPMPVGAEGEPVPPFEEETWRIDITHGDEYWLNVRYKVFRPGWSFSDGGFSGAHVTGHSGCGEAYSPMLLNTAYAADGEHEIIVYFGGHCTHLEDPGEETKYDRYPNGTQIFIDATLEHFLPGEMTPIEIIPLSSTVLVTTDAPPPVSLGAIAVSHPPPQADAPATTTSSSSTTGAEAGAAGGLGEETAGAAADTDAGLPLGVLILAVALLVGIAAAILLVRELLGRGEAPMKQAAHERANRVSAQTDQEAAQAGSAWFRERATHVIEPGQFVWVHNPKFLEQAKAEGKEIPPGMDAPLPLSLEPEPVGPDHPKEPARMVQAQVRDGVTVIYDPAHPNVAVLRTGAQVWIQPGQLTALPSDEFVPTHELTGTKYIEGRTTDQVITCQPGTPVQVITTTGDETLVRIDANTELWVPRSSVAPGTARADPVPPADQV